MNHCFVLLSKKQQAPSVLESFPKFDLKFCFKFWILANLTLPEGYMWGLLEGRACGTYTSDRLVKQGMEKKEKRV